MSTQNFLDPTILNKAKLPLDQCEKVMVANGELIPNEGKCNGGEGPNTWNYLYNGSASIGLGCDMVLGIKWLRYLGSILWNFGDLKMKFGY